MATDERERHRFYEKAVELFGERGAVFLMEHLPPRDEELATKKDLEILEARLEARMQRALRSQLMMFVGVMTLMNAGMFTAFRLTL